MSLYDKYKLVQGLKWLNVIMSSNRQMYVIIINIIDNSYVFGLMFRGLLNKKHFGKKNKYINRLILGIL